MANQRNMLDVFGQSDLGLKRQTNQDHFLVAELRKRLRIGQTNIANARKGITGRKQAHLLIVADGMGGMAEGGEASRLSVLSFMRSAANGLDLADSTLLAASMVKAAKRCRKQLVNHAAASGVTRSMGTTLTAACVVDHALTLLHVGDSRCYVLRKAKLSRLTTDHTMAQRLAEEGAMNEKQAAASPFAHVLWNSISSSPKSELKPQVVQHELKPGDVLLLCTDGLTKHLDDKRIAQVLKSKTGAQQRAEQLVAESREKGGTDNVTVIVAQLG